VGVWCFSIFTSCRFPGCSRTKSQSRSQSEYCLHSVCILSFRCSRESFHASLPLPMALDDTSTHRCLCISCIRLSVVLSCWYCGTALFPPFFPTPSAGHSIAELMEQSRRRADVPASQVCIYSLQGHTSVPSLSLPHRDIPPLLLPSRTTWAAKLHAKRAH